MIRRLQVDWPAFHAGRGLQADITLHTPPGHESMTIVIPIEERRFYYNHKINCLPAEGTLQYGDLSEAISPDSSLGSLDWGRGSGLTRATGIGPAPPAFWPMVAGSG